MKKCTKCNVDKPLNEFYKHKTHKDGLKHKCKECLKKFQKNYRQKNKDKIREYSKQWKKDNPEYQKQWSKKNKTYNKVNKEKKYQANKKWYKENKEYHNKWIKQRRLTDIEFRLRHNLRIRINQAIHKFNFKKKNTSIEELGCSIQKYVVYLGQQFDKNMNWGNYGTYWEIDHIYPVSKGGSFHYTNTQPLTIEENRSKGNKI